SPDAGARRLPAPDDRRAAPRGAPAHARRGDGGLRRCHLRGGRVDDGGRQYPGIDEGPDDGDRARGGGGGILGGDRPLPDPAPDHGPRELGVDPHPAGPARLIECGGRGDPTAAGRTGTREPRWVYWTPGEEMLIPARGLDRTPRHDRQETDGCRP